MTQREKLIELLERLTRFCISRATCRFCKYRNNAPFCINEAIADHLIENGVVLVDTNSVKRENLPLIQQAFGMPLDELAELVRARIEGRLACRVGDKTFLLLEKEIGSYDIVESKCVRITDNGYAVYYSMAFDCAEIGNTLEFGVSAFGKTVFFTRKEAEKSLKERESNAETPET